MSVKVKIDTSKFERKLKTGIKNALYKTGYDVLEQAHYLAPIEHGALVGSGYVQVGKNIHFNPIGEADDGNPPPNPNNKNKELELRVGYSVPYAAQLHDNPFNPGKKSEKKGLSYPGYKWLSNTIKKMDLKKIFREYLEDETN